MFASRQTHTRGPWWSIRPAWILLGAVLGTQVVATLIAVYGVSLVTPLGCKYAGMVWGYALAWFLAADPVKLLAYKVLNQFKAHTHTSANAKKEGKATAAPAPADDAKHAPEAKAATTSDAKIADATPPPETKAAPPSNPPSDASPQPTAKADAKVDAKAGPEAAAVTPTLAKPIELPALPVTAKPATVDKSAAAAPAGPKPQANAEPAPEPELETGATAPANLTPALVDRVHKLYEELGRQEVRAVEEMEKAARAGQKPPPDNTRLPGLPAHPAEQEPKSQHRHP